MTGNNFTDFQIQLLPPMYGVQFCLALLGNTCALWLLVTKERKNWHTGVVFSCNLAISDLLYVFSLPLLAVYYVRGKDWPFGMAACKAERFLFTCNLYVSILFITCISINRYVAIVHPFFTHQYVRPRHAKIASVLTWLLVALLSFPVLHFANTCPAGKGSNATECVSSCRNEDERANFTYSVLQAVFGGLLPFVATLISYGAITRVVWRNPNITTLEKKKVVLLVASVLVLYAVSVMPYHILRNQHLYNKMKQLPVGSTYNAYQVTKGLVTLSMCIHPILYMAVFDSIRTACCGAAEGVENANGGEECGKRKGDGHASTAL